MTAARITAVPVGDIRVAPNRQRSSIDPEKLAELATSIKENGLLHPIVVRVDEEGSYWLVAGERRLSAYRLLQLEQHDARCGGITFSAGFVPAVLLGQLPPLEAATAELEENLRRVDITLQDQARAVALLASLRPKASRQELGQEAFPDLHPNQASSKTRTLLAVAANLDKVPGLASAKSLNEASKLLRRHEVAEQNARLAEAIGTKAATELHEVHHADCRTWLESRSGQEFDCVLIDPPYGMDAGGFGDAAGKLQGITHTYDDSAGYFRGLMQAIAGPLTAVAKDESHLYIWCDIDGFHFLRDLFTQHGWYVFRTPLINIKREGGRVPLPEHGPRRCYELCLYAFRGKRPVTAIYPDVFESTLEGDNLGHGAQKPVEAYINLLRRSCRPGDRVLDCFAGTGTILSAAHTLGLRATAVEIDAANYGLCLKRLEGLE